MDSYRARIYPVAAGGKRRVVLRYIELQPDTDGTLEYIYPMGSGDPVRIDEFSLSVDLGDAGKKMKIATLADARIEQGGRLVTMRRSGYTPRADFQLEARLPDRPPPLRLARFKAGGDSADYVLARYSPDLDFSKVKQPRGDVVVVVDTSAAGDEASRQLKASIAEAILRALSDDDRFALVSLDVKSTVLHPAKGLAPASDEEISSALEALADHASGGAGAHTSRDPLEGEGERAARRRELREGVRRQEGHRRADGLRVGDVLARAGLSDEAVRIYSEIVEFDPESVPSRRLLGDIYLGHGWYDPAYSQYRTLTEEAPDDMLGWLRLAAAAAGTGRVDEALRIERKVASAQGNPGPTDPRRWARLWSAERLAALIEDPPKAAPGQPAVDPKRRVASIQRELKQLQLFSGPGTLVLLTWEQLDADLLLVERLDGKDVGLGEVTDAARAGLSSTLLSTADAARAGFVARLRSEPGERPVALRRTDIAWNSKGFSVRIEHKTLPAGAKELEL